VMLYGELTPLPVVWHCYLGALRIDLLYGARMAAMTHFAGAYLKDPRESTRLSAIASHLEAAFPAPAEAISIRRSDGFVLISSDNDCFPDACPPQSGTPLLGIAGDPLPRSAGCRRGDQVPLLSAGLLTAPHSTLAACDGTFALVQYNSQDHSLLLATDKLGLRPVYFWSDDHSVVFSTSLRCIERCAAVRKSVSIRGLFEQLTLGFSLADRTRYAGVFRLRPGELVAARGTDVERCFYFRWDRISSIDDEPAAIVRRTYELFLAAVERRAWRSSECFAHLSGGLDSRIIVGALLTLGKRTTALNFAPDSYVSQDEAYAKALADRLGIRLLSIPMPIRGGSWGSLSKQAANRLGGFDDSRPPLIFSGDGGSVGLGCVYLSKPLIAALRAGDEQSAIRDFVSTIVGFSPRVMPGRAFVETQRALYNGIRSELETLSAEVEPGRRFHLFLMHNDQHRHLTDWYEYLEENQTDYLLPFYDGQFLEYVLACPLDPFVDHALYHELLPLFPVDLSSTPWQTYPGHLPCPVTPGESCESQFKNKGKHHALTVGRPWLQASERALFSRAYPKGLFRRPAVAAAAVAQRLGLRDYTYIHSAVSAAHDAWAVAEGRTTWDLSDDRV
jgi:asparagine synthase (glutamine-hydrolysing)